MLLGGVCWLAFALVLGWLLFQYLREGAGAVGFVGISSTSVWVGVVHFSGFVIASFLCFAVGTGLCARGLVPSTRPKVAAARDVKLGQRDKVEKAVGRQEATSLCVCCRVALSQPTEICPECGWTQPCRFL